MMKLSESYRYINLQFILYMQIISVYFYIKNKFTNRPQMWKWKWKSKSTFNFVIIKALLYLGVHWEIFIKGVLI